MFNRFFKPATALTRTTRAFTAYQKFNQYRHDHGPELLWGGLFGGVILGTSGGFSMGVTSSISGYMQAKKNNSLFNLGDIPEQIALHTGGGAACGALAGVGLALALLAPEAALVGMGVTLACREEKPEEKRAISLRR